MNRSQITSRLSTIIVLILFLRGFTMAQQVEIRGKILSTLDDEPVPFATVSVQRLKTGTSADENGYFVLSLDRYRETDILLISSVGYRSKNVLLSELGDEKEHIFRLEPSIMELEELVVTAKDTDPAAIVGLAAKNLNKTMSSRPYLIAAVYNEKVEINDKLAGVLQGFGIAYIEGYRERSYAESDRPRDQIQWKQLRRSAYKTGELKSFVGAYKLLKAKDNYLYKGPVNSAGLRNYEFTLDSISTYNDMLVYLISFISKKGDETGSLVIDEETYSIISMKVNNTRETRDYDVFNKIWKPEFSRFSMSMSRAGKIYYINSLQLELGSVKKTENGEAVMHEIFELFAGQYTSSAGIRKTNHVQKQVLFYEMVNPLINYSVEFWDQNPQINFPVSVDTSLQKEFKANNGKRIVPLPDGFSNYQDLYNDRQMLDLYFGDF